MDDRLQRYRDAGLKAVRFQLGYQQPDGGYVWEGYARDAFHKQAYSWALAGAVEPAHRLLTWVKENRLQADGQLSEYGGDCYKHSWFFQGAHRLSRFDLSYPVMGFLKSCMAPCGGLPHFAGDPYCRSLATCCTGLSALTYGDLPMAERIAAWAIRMLEGQPEESRFYFRTTLDGTLVTPAVSEKDALCIDVTKPKQDHWEVGLPLQLMCRLYQATGREEWLGYAKRFFEFTLRSHDDAYGWAGSGKSALGAALTYLCTGDRRARQCACAFCDFLLETQYPEGGWRDETEPDTILIYIDHAAEFNIWLHEISSLIPGADVRWGA